MLHGSEILPVHILVRPKLLPGFESASSLGLLTTTIGSGIPGIISEITLYSLTRLLVARSLLCAQSREEIIPRAFCLPHGGIVGRDSGLGVAGRKVSSQMHE